MTTQEFTDQFDILYNNITSNQAPGLDEYEKSVFLTIAQDDIVKGYYNLKGNKFAEGYGDNPKRDIDFSMLIKVKSYSLDPNDQSAPSGQEAIHPLPQFDTHMNAVSVEFPTDILFVINEQLIVYRDEKRVPLQVVPLNYMEYTRLMSRPYKRPLVNQAWRISNDYDKRRQVDLVPGASDGVYKYIIRYIRRPNKIVLDLDNWNDTPCELDPELHLEILKRAVELAKSAYIGDLTSGISLGQVSSTNLGIVSQQQRSNSNDD